MMLVLRGKKEIRTRVSEEFKGYLQRRAVLNGRSLSGEILKRLSDTAMTDCFDEPVIDEKALTKGLEIGDRDAEFLFGRMLYQAERYGLAKIFFKQATDKGHVEAKKYLERAILAIQRKARQQD